jgi:hypothetical protein
MAITYDEVWITTGREIKVCEDAIKAYRKELRSFEERYRISTEEFINNSGTGKEAKVTEKDRKKWYELYLGLKRTEERLKGLQAFLERS